MTYANPYDAFAGVFIPHFVLSSRSASPGAKILYALLASGADVRGETLLNPALLAAKMGADEAGVLELVEELVAARLVKVRQDPTCAEFLSCHFPPDAWRRDAEPPAGAENQHASRAAPRLLKMPGTKAEQSAAAGESGLASSANPTEGQGVDCGQGQRGAGSRFSKEICIEYAKARQQAEWKIDNPYALGTAMSKTAEYDEEIESWLRSKESGRSVA